MVGIPCRVVTGYAIWVDPQSLETVDHTNSNHAWNEAFVDARWVIIDTTWDSTNRYKNGIFMKGDIRHIYVDPTLKVFSLDHKIISN
ncbi:transglutaminase domain-containing protein [Clostridium sp. DSM 17811]|nr:transglutaminase domain-containing protein [Clostridium sp. DSM 17811]